MQTLIIFVEHRIIEIIEFGFSRGGLHLPRSAQFFISHESQISNRFIIHSQYFQTLKGENELCFKIFHTLQQYRSKVISF